MKKLKTYQFNVIARFCEDVSKALVIAVILGQIAISTSVSVRIILSVATCLVALIMLYFAIYFSREGK
ncbi:hypothetical protein COX03_00200 [Candidatus Woesebacteria bacterium CG22_combo_CG10-13_8_21_14_all_39_10]|uniref:Uncharacterized protein n=1 Tax=Candidatus Woesebacteria bacterium CG22_combo_CG10-13_8_21_14_all_39_10 TaxID=1975059 RepID=A0A2H0BK36_9BACT|nr:MAG: hypothetical protein COX03_00200 [Candidatus Woesebacteria bacterium CG22_combo_CG10-13_8_21_14_all_39_10]